MAKFITSKMLVKNILVQYEDDNGETNNALMSEYEFIKWFDMRDCNPIVSVRVFKLSDNMKAAPKELHYTGWQPNCLMEFADTMGNVIISGYGTDH